MKNLRYLALLALILSACNSAKRTEKAFQGDVQKFLQNYNNQYQKLYTQSSEAQWKLNTYIVADDTITARRAEQATEAYAKFTGSSENIEKAQKFLESRSRLSNIQIKQLEKILYMAGNNPQTVEETVKQRIKAETEQTQKLFGYEFTIDGKKYSTNQIDSILNYSTDLQLRKKAWEASKEVGRVLKNGLANLQELRNATVQGLGFPNYFNYQVSDYGMNSDDMLELNRSFIRDIWPLYRELHTYARYELAKKYNVKEIPEYLPAHWLPNRWGQDWSAMKEVKGMNVDSMLGTKSAEWVIQKGEAFYQSLGFEALPKSFYEKSSLYPVPPNANYAKNTHASAWHIDLDQDVRSLMSVEPNAEWYETVNHELGHIYYYLAYANKDVPYVLREGANRAYHEAFGTLIGMAAMQKPFLAANGLLPENAKTDSIQTLLKQALNYVVFMPWSAGVMTEFEYHLYEHQLPEQEYNARWWDLVKRYQGIVPPQGSQRSGMSASGDDASVYCDACSKTHINDDAAQYYDYALSFVILFQVHEYISLQLLQQHPHNANYYGSAAVGNFLKDIMAPGASRDWRELYREKIGNDLSAQPMLRYFEPLIPYLKKVNQGRIYTLPESF